MGKFLFSKGVVCRGKVSYDSYYESSLAACKMGCKRGHRRRVYPYRCSDCQRWHNSSCRNRRIRKLITYLRRLELSGRGRERDGVFFVRDSR